MTPTPDNRTRIAPKGVMGCFGYPVPNFVSNASQGPFWAKNDPKKKEK